jgi:hypothetical protein
VFRDLNRCSVRVAGYGLVDEMRFEVAIAGGFEGGVRIL